jgi:hypothetical protein
MADISEISEAKEEDDNEDDSKIKISQLLKKVYARPNS